MRSVRLCAVTGARRSHGIGFLLAVSMTVTNTVCGSVLLGKGAYAFADPVLTSR
jgi:hypothetical protein